MVHPLLLDLAEPRRGRHPVAGRSQGLEVPFGVEVDRIGDRTARDEEALHLFEVVLQAVVVAREDARRERRFEHVALELDPVADLQSAGAVEYLHVGAVSHDLDDLGHHADTARVHVTYLVLAHGSVGFTITIFEMIPFTCPVVFIIRILLFVYQLFAVEPVEQAREHFAPRAFAQARPARHDVHAHEVRQHGINIE